MSDADPGATRWDERLLVALLRIYPRAFRARFGEGITYALVREYRGARERGRLAAAASWLRIAGSVVANGLAERTSRAGRTERKERAGMEHVRRDLAQAVRRLARRPGFTVAAIVTLALGIGPTTAIFTIVDGVLLEPLPYVQADRLVRLVEQNRPDNRWNISAADFLGVRDQQQVFESVAAILTVGATAELSGVGAPERVDVGRVTADWLRVLGVEPIEGRDFRPDEDRPGSEPVVILGSAFRDRVFGEGADALGATVTLDGTPYTVIGVLGPERASLAGVEADVWPLMTMDTPPRRGPFFMTGIGRLRPDRTLEDARADLDAISRRIFSVWADTGFRDDQARITPYPLKELMLGTVGDGLWLMLAGVAGVLLIAVSNVGGLFMVHAAERDTEMALRTSLGATRTRLAVQLTLESLLVSVVGGALGCLFAWLGLEAFLATEPSLPRVADIRLDTSVLVAVAAVALGSALLFGLAPLARVVSRPGSPMPGAARAGGARSPGWTRVRAGLVTAQFAVAFGLTTGAGLLIGSFQRLQRVDPGFEARNVVALQMSLPEGRYPDYDAVQEFWREALAAVGAVPGVEAAGILGGLPPGLGSAGTNDFELLDRPLVDGESAPQALWNWVSPDALTALSIPLLRGRTFLESDRDGPPVLLVSESWERQYYPDGGALGAQLYVGGDRSVAMTVVGVVGDVKYRGLDATDDAGAYEPHWQTNMRSAWLVVRGRPAGSAGLVDGVRATFADLDPDLPLSDVQTLEERTSRSLARPRQWTVLLGLFALLGLSLACVGVYGVLSYHVSTQRKEIGVRVSLGAEPRVVRRYVIARGMTLAVVGIGIGIVVSLIGARWLRALVFGLSPYDPLTMAGAAVGMLVVALLACSVPAVRATRIDPASTLKGD